MNLEITPTKFDELCEHAEELEATVVRQEKELRRLQEALNVIKRDAGTYFQATNDHRFNNLYQLAHFTTYRTS